MSDKWRLALALAIVALFVAAVGAATYAQSNTPAECSDPKFDFSGDGKVTHVDPREWRLLSQRTGCDPREGSPVSDDGCAPRLDLDGDGWARPDDVMLLIDIYHVCERPAWVYPQR
jgi:hypothetical protein